MTPHRKVMSPISEKFANTRFGVAMPLVEAIFTWGSRFQGPGGTSKCSAEGGDSMYQSEPIIKLVRATRAVAFLHLAIGVVRLVMLVILILSADNPQPELLWKVVAIAADHGVPAGLIFFFGSRVARGAIWAAYGIVTVAALELSSMLVFLMLGSDLISAGLTLACFLPIALVLKLPTLYLAASCLNALTELRHLNRARQRESRYFTGGFPVVAVASTPPTMASAKPPPRPTK